jgi:hypothetical protein
LPDDECGLKRWTWSDFSTVHLKGRRRIPTEWPRMPGVSWNFGGGQCEHRAALSFGGGQCEHRAALSFIVRDGEGAWPTAATGRR